MDVGALVDAIMDRPGPTRLVAIDAPGGAGKSTFAARLAESAGGAPVIHTDDFASAGNPINWWPRMLTQVIEPLSRGAAAVYQRYDWPSETLADWHTVEPAPIVIIEGVSAGRAEWSKHLSFVIWIDTPSQERLRRGVERDGPDALHNWESGMAAEDAHYARDPTRERADAIVDGMECDGGTAADAGGRSSHAVVAAAIVRDDQVLLCHRHPTRTWYPNVWDLPGGHVEAGEQRLDALARELREELGIDIDPCGSASVLRHRPTPDLDIEVWVVTSWSGEIVNAEPIEHDRIGWFSRDDLKRLDLAEPGVDAACIRALDFVRSNPPDHSAR